MRYAPAVLALLVTVACGNPRSPLQPNTPSGGGLVAEGQYQVVELATLGGASAIPTAINDAGQIAGVSEAITGGPHAFLWDNGTMRDLGTLRGGTSEAHAINARGQVAGMSVANGAARVFLWDNGTMRDLGPDNARFVIVRWLTAAGDVVATVFWYDGRVSSVMWRGGGAMQDLGNLNPSEPEAYAYAADETGRVAGQSIVFEAGPTAYYHPFLWDGAQMRDLGVLGQTGDTALCATQVCGQGLAADVNGSGQVIGWSTDSVAAVRAFLWDNGTLRDLGAFPGRLTWAVSLNDLGQVVGEYAADLHTEMRAFIWQDGAARDLGSLGGDRTGVLAINEEGLVAGYGTTAAGNTHAFVWRADRMFDLGSGAPTAMNERGDIVGVTSTPLGPQRAVLWRRILPPALVASLH